MAISKSKSFLFILLLFSTAAIYSQQKNYTISALSGLLDNQHNTHLLYRLYWFQGYYPLIYFADSNSVYDLNLTSGSDTLLMRDGGQCGNTNATRTILDYEFWNNDLSKYIYGGDDYGFIQIGYIKRFDNTYDTESNIHFDTVLGVTPKKIQISHQNDSLLYLSGEGLYKSLNGGLYWNLLNRYYDLINISPFNDRIIYALGNNYLCKSVDGGVSFEQVDTIKSVYYLSEQYNWLNFFLQLNNIYFDKDSLHLYSTSCDDSTFVRHFSVSDNKGEPNSWYVKYSSSHNIFVAVDTVNSGKVFLADSNEILVSNNYGTSFSVYKTLDSAIVGIYEKPGTDTVYAATSHDIYELTPISVTSIKKIVTAVEQSKSKVPIIFQLSQNYPNPFNPSTVINYEISKSSFVKIKVYDILGREIAIMVNEEEPAGKYSITFNGGNLSSGIYFYSITAGSFHQTKKMMLLK
jgi:Secretion system C-terminal sorting domain